MHRGHPKRHGQRACCARKSLESIVAHERNEVTTTQGFSLVFTARPHMSFTVRLIGFFFTLGLAYLFQKILGRSYWCSWRSLSSSRWFSGGHASTNAEMNGRFGLASRVSPPQGRTVMVRSGGLVFSAALRRSGWALISGSGETSIPNPPEEWWLDDALAKEMGWTSTQLRLKGER
jgi:hypothetical protein